MPLIVTMIFGTSIMIGLLLVMWGSDYFDDDEMWNEAGESTSDGDE